MFSNKGGGIVGKSNIDKVKEIREHSKIKEVTEKFRKVPIKRSH
jgi:hypothetical protein